MELKYKAVRGIFWSAVQRGGNQAIAFLIFLALSRLLEPEAFGLVALATIFTSFVQLFVDQGFSLAIVQFPEIERAHLDTAFWTAVMVGCSMAAVGVASSDIIAGFFDEPELAPVIVWLSLDLILLSLSSTQRACLLRDMDFKGLATRTLVATSVGGVAGIGAAFAGFGVYSLVIKTIVIHLVGAIVLWNISDWRPGFRFSRQHFRALFKFGSNITANNILIFLSKQADNFLIGRFMGATALGYYSIAYNFVQMLLDLFVTTSTSVTISTFSRLQEDREEMRHAFYKATRYSSLIAFPAFIGVSLLSPILVPALFGQKWLASVPVMQVLALMGLIYPIAIFNTQVLVAAGKPSWRLTIMIVYAIVDVIGFVIAVRWGIIAVAVALVLRMFLLSPLSYFAVHKILKIDFGVYFRQLLAPLAGTLALVAAVLGLSWLVTDLANPYLEISLLTVSGGIVYLLVIQLTAPKVTQELLELVRPTLQGMSPPVQSGPGRVE